MAIVFSPGICGGKKVLFSRVESALKSKHVVFRVRFSDFVRKEWTDTVQLHDELVRLIQESDSLPDALKK